jgi:signal peptidase II
MLSLFAPATRKWLWLALAVIVADHVTKWWISATLDYREAVPVLPFFSLVLVHNTGAAFSFLANAGGWQRWFFTGVGAVATVILLHLLRKHAHDTRLALAFALVLGGPLGNYNGRVRCGSVVDCLHVPDRACSCPAFNVADAAISVGAALLVWDALRRRPSTDKPAAPKHAP